MQRAARLSRYSPEYYDRFLYGITLESLRLTNFRIKIKQDGNSNQLDYGFQKTIIRMGKKNHQKMKIVFA